jgi:putative PIN family toxin of toxin-antitoxin system
VIRAVLDTNVLASGFISEQAAPGQLMAAWAAGWFELCVSEYILEELERALSKDYFRRAVGPEWSTEMLDRLRSGARLVDLTTDVQGVASHPEDDPVLATAMSCTANFLVTGDKQLLALHPFRGISVVDPATFRAVLIDDRSR